MNSAILIPDDRTQRQPITAYCVNVECIPQGASRFEFPVEHEAVCCPKCGATEAPMIGLLALIHFLIRTPKGPILGSGGIRFGMACDPQREYLATGTNLEAATDQLEASNCPQCRRVAIERNLNPLQGTVLQPD